MTIRTITTFPTQNKKFIIKPIQKVTSFRCFLNLLIAIIDNTQHIIQDKIPHINTTSCRPFLYKILLGVDHPHIAKAIAATPVISDNKFILSTLILYTSFLFFYIILHLCITYCIFNSQKHMYTCFKINTYTFSCCTSA